MSGQLGLCPVCGMGRVHRHVEQVVFEYRGQQLRAEEQCGECDACGTQQGSLDDVRDNLRAKQRARKLNDGLLMGEEVRAIRKELSLTQEKAQELFGGGPVAFSKYENDEVLHSSLLDRTLRTMRSCPDYLKAYAREAGVTLANYQKAKALMRDAATFYESAQSAAVEVSIERLVISTQPALRVVESDSAYFHGISETPRAPRELVVAQHVANRR